MVVPFHGSLFGQLAQATGKTFALQVCRSAAGYYVGTHDEHGAPYSRESAEYWPTITAAETALRRGRWTQRLEP